jgi:hypothetical protein
MKYRIKYPNCADGMIMVLVGDAIRFPIHPSLRHHPSRRTIIASEIDDYHRGGGSTSSPLKTGV